MRLFVALDLDPEIRRRIAVFLDGVRGFAPDARWVSPESLHVTLKFIGESERLEDIRRALAGIGGAATQLSLRGTGFFPSPGSARVFWVGIEADENLSSLVAAIDSALVQLGIDKEPRPYTPHLTLARSASGGPRSRSRHRGQSQTASPFQRVVTRLAKMPPPDFGTMSAREFSLYQSKTAPTGAVYTKLARFPLG